MQRARRTPLKLDGELLKLVRIALDGEELPTSRYVVTDTDLTINNVPSAPFTLEIETICDPEANKALSGLYRSQGVYCTQCEAEGFRKITYYLDRPDVMSKFTTTVVAESTAIRCCSPTATRLPRARRRRPALGNLGRPVHETGVPVCAGGR